MNIKQKESLAKYSYDLSKIIFTVLVIGQIVAEKFKLWIFLSGVVDTIVFFLIGFLLEKGEQL